MSLVGVPVVGSIGDIPAATSRYMLQEVLLAIPEAPPEMIADVLRSAEAAGIAMKVLPTVHDVVNGPTDMFAIRRAREPSIEDLLGRTPVATDLDGVRRSLEGPPCAGHRGRRLHRFGDLPPGRRVRSRPARPPRPRRDAPPRHRRHGRRTLPTGSGRHHRPRHPLRGVRAVPARRRAPHRRPQARSGARGPPGRGRPDQRIRDAQRDRGIGRGRRQSVRADLVRQGRVALERHGCLQAGGRTGAA